MTFFEIDLLMGFLFTSLVGFCTLESLDDKDSLNWSFLDPASAVLGGGFVTVGVLFVEFRKIVQLFY